MLFATAMAGVLGHTHPFDLDRLVHRADGVAGTPHSTGRLVIAVVAFLLASTGAGLAAEGCGSMIERCWLAADWSSWPRPVHRLVHNQIQSRQAR
ncbi:hypothetical protein [Streptomyces sp. NPDC002671]